MRAQVMYIRPVLQRIINDAYAPARWRHTQFMRGHAKRGALAQNVEMGNLSEAEGAGLLAEVRRWALRDQRVAEVFVENEDENEDKEDRALRRMERGGGYTNGSSPGMEIGGSSLVGGSDYLRV
ncbi:hypothetical protein BOTBODRAFT_490118 [Botryobasidium botryosum FD-172 SS1]|uniref:Uncharacterized protein n=1 Tax=Botryobasidium botryosum (strain FD-172 SS1) TaxID=930990 RepID=A0A067M4S8_BOTB1|nr:hypothetical protein BOTBODRAFT_490118 [Botryobasidium botryosum FD-172 SS1]